MNQIRESRFWKPLWKQYANSPSIALCRVPEMEYASNLDTRKTFLDHCCGDGLFASIAWNNAALIAGCDVSESAIGWARQLGIYKQLDICDASRTLPYDDNSFDIVFNNSALEHILNIDSVLKEVARVLKPGGEFAFNVLNHRYFEWWPFDASSKQAYKDWQPFYHALNISEWLHCLERAGLKIVDFEGYFNRQASKKFAKLDYWFSGAALRNLQFTYVRLYRRLGIVFHNILSKQLESLEWKTAPDEGAGYFVRTVK